MTWLGVLQALLTLAGALASWMRDRQLMQAGEALAINAGLRQAMEGMRAATAARNAVRNAARDNPSGVRDSDGFRRD